VWSEQEICKWEMEGEMGEAGKLMGSGRM
jgi:hypothetical protein